MLIITTCANASTNNYAFNRPVTVSSTYTTNYGSNAVDAVVSDTSRWLGNPSGAGNWLEINFTTNVTLAQAHIYSGYQMQSGSWVTNIQLQSWSGSTWTNIPGGAITNTNSFAVVLNFDAPVTTERLRLFTADTTYARLREITLWDEPQSLYTGVTGDYVPGSALLGAPVLVNQIGYQLGAPKRFTAPTSTNGSPFSITTTNTTNALFSGSILDGRADFSAFEPASSGPYVIHVGGATNGVSFPFLILSNLISAKYTVPAAQFMTDSRSGIGTHKSAFGGTPWRDGTYYSFEIPSLVYLLLNDRATVESIPRDINYAVEQATVLATNFPFITTTEDSGFLAALRRYYTNQPPPLTTNLPDAVQAIHFGLGVTLERPSTRDWSGDERPRQIHAQTVEWCAYFLHAWPVLRNWLDDGFYRNVRDFALTNWGVSSGLTNASASDDDPSSLEIDPLWAASSYGTVDKHPYKGRHAPGHSILPNLLMYQVAQREGRSDATNYLNAAKTQAQWIIDNLDWANPRTTKGHRMSEHKMMPGLVYFATQFPNDAPAGLVAKIQSWADTMMARSDNAWDFRVYETNDFDGDGLVDWSLPKFTQNWNEPGNLAGFPACALAAKQVVTNAATKQRLTEISWATMDCLFGRNPLNATSASRLSLGFPDAEVGWTPIYSGSAGYLDLCRGALASGPATEHFPYNPAGAKRHNEGWVNFNASWNVGLSYLLADLNGRSDTLEVHLPIIISEILSAPTNPLAEFIELWNPTPYPARLSGLVIGGGVSFAFPTNTFTELAPGARCLIVRDVAAFTNQFGAGLPVVGTFTGDLADAGETLTLGDVNGNIFATLDYSAFNIAAGHSAVFMGSETNFPGSAWNQSAEAGGSPGTSGATLAATTISFRQGVGGYTHVGALIRGDNTSLNSGVRDQLIVGKNSKPLRAVLSFPLPSVPTNAIVTNVTLDLWTDAQAGAGTVGALELRALNGTPTEGTGDGSGNGAGSGATWLSRTGGSVWTNVWVSEGADYTVPVLSSVPGFNATTPNVQKTFASQANFLNAAQAAVSAGQPLNLMLLSPATEAGANDQLTRLTSDESANTNQRPRLTVAYSPERAPFSLVALPSSWAEVRLNWKENLTNETGFVIERMTGTNGVWQTVITTTANVTAATDCSVSAATTYSYRVRGVFADGSGSVHSSATVTTPAAILRPPIVVMPLGDSITQGAGAAGGYRDPLHTLLANAGYPIQFVGSDTNNSTAILDAAGNAAHEGHGSYMTTDLLANFDANVAGPSANNGGFWLTGITGTRPPVFPDVVLVMAGVNDLGVNQLPPEQGLAGLDALLNNLSALRPSAWIIVSTLTPYTGTVYPNREANNQTFNAAVPALVGSHQAAGHRVTWCDVRTRVNLTNAASLLTGDGVHPNAAGYAEIAQVWFEAFQKLPLIENWRQANFGLPANSGNAADAADWDGDGECNLAEFNLGTSPTNSVSVESLLTNFLNESGTNYLSITFPRRKHSDLSCVVEVVPEISGATPWTNQVLQVGPPVGLDADFEQVTFRDIVPMEAAPMRFMRLKVTKP